MWSKNLPRDLLRRIKLQFQSRFGRRFLAAVAFFLALTVLLLALLPRRAVLQTVGPAPVTGEHSEQSDQTPAPDQITSLVPNFSSGYDYTLAAQVPGTVRIPVFAYHHIAEYDPADTYLSREYYVSATNFRAQMQYLKDKGYRTIGTQEFWRQVQTGVNPVQKTVLLTFGDGYADNYSTAFPILKEFGFTATFFIITGRRGIDDAQLLEMEAAGMEIQNHTETHSNLALNNSEEFLNTELQSSKAKLEAFLGAGGVDSLLYPACAYTDYVVQKLIDLRYRIAFGCNPTIDHSPAEQYRFGRLYAYESLEDFKQKLSGIY